MGRREFERREMEGDEEGRGRREMKEEEGEGR